MKQITGNILDITHGTILHQVNCRGILGGVAQSLHAKYPVAFTDYLLLCEKYGSENAGTCHEGHVNRSLSILHVFAQVDPGAGTELELLQWAFRSISCRPRCTPVYAPYGMGCGIGGGNWDDYSKILNRFFPDITIVQLP